MKFALGLVIAVAASAQVSKVEFDVASLRAAPANTGASISANGGSFTFSGPTGGPNTASPERYTYRGARVRDLIAKAYGLVDANEFVAGPEWLSKRWDMAATMPATTTPAQFQEMLRNLLLDRFHVKMHLESNSPLYTN